MKLIGKNQHKNFSQNRRGNLHLKERKQHKQHWWSESHKKKFQQQQLCKIIFHFHTNISNLFPKGKFHTFRLFFNSNKSAPFFYPINNFSKKATRFRLLFCVVPYFLARLQAPIITPQNTPFILRLNAKHFCSTTG